MNEFWEWLNANSLWLGIFSGIVFVGSLIVIPILVAHIPNNYFVGQHHRLSRFQQFHPALHVTIVIFKNIAGSLLILAGIAMLVLPGQGMLTILIGISLTDFPGKYTLEQKLIDRDGIFNALNWIRKKTGKHPLLRPHTNNYGKP